MSAVRSRVLSATNNTMIRQGRMGGKCSMIRVRSLGTSTDSGAKAVDPEEYFPGAQSSHSKNSDIGGESSSRERCAVKVYSSFSSAWSSSPSSSSDDDGCIEYARSWAWQQTLLSRRMALRRRADADNTVPCEKNGTLEYSMPLEGDHDSILLLEHKPVYTLGRGADENHLIFLQEEHKVTVNYQDLRDRLSRKGVSRAASTTRATSARLVMDRRFDQNSILERPMDDVVNELSRIATPVMAPNGVPIYRVDRGGEVTFHGPNQLVCYPLLDLRQAPFRQDLHWYLRMVEEVVIQTLQHYDIKSKRDDINTGA
jgi:lipoate-protein ligase B